MVNLLNFLSFLMFYFFSTTLLIAQDSVSEKAIFKINTIKYNLNSAKNKNDTLGIAENFIFLADFYKDLGLGSEAIKNYYNAQELYLIKDTLFVYTNNQIASIHLELKQFSEASQYAKKSIYIAKSLNYYKGLANANAILGSVNEKEGRYTNALNYQNLSLALFESLNDSTGIALTNENLGSIYEDLEQYDLAQNYFNIAHDFEKSTTSNLKINIINNQSDVFRKLKQYDQALKLTNIALRLARNKNNKQQEESALKDLARTYAELEDFENAYKYLNEQNLINQKEFKNQNLQLVSAMEVLYNVKESEAQLAILNKQNQLNRTRQIAVIIISLAVILVFVIGLIHLKKRKRHEQKLLTYKQQLLQADLDIKIAEEMSLKREIDIKISALTNYSLNLAHKNKLLADVSRTLNNIKGRNPELIKIKLIELVKTINSDLSKENEWSELMTYFSQINPNFFKDLKSQAHKELTSSEMRLCMLLRLNLSSKAIASILNITPDSVRVARYRMRKKLPLTSKDDLQSYILNL